MNSAQAISYFIENDNLFDDCLPPERSKMIATVQVLEFGVDDVIYQNNTETDNLYYVVEGEVTLVFKDRDPIVVHPGQYFGEETAIEAHIYSGKAVAKSPVIVIRIPENSVEALTRKYKKIKNSFFFSFTKKTTDIEFDHKEIKIKEVEPSRESIKILGWVMATLLPLALYMFLPQNTFDYHSRAFVSILMSALGMWVFALVPPYVPAVFIVLTALILGVAPTKVVLSGFASDSFMMALSVFGLGSVILSSGIVYRLLLKILQYLPSSQFWANASVFLVGLLLTPTVPAATGRNQLMGPLTADFIQNIHFHPKSSAACKLSITAYASVTLLSPIFLSASIHNFIILGLLWAQDQERFQWLGWLQAASVTGMILVFFMCCIIAVMLRNQEIPMIDREKIEHQLKVLGTPTIREKVVLACFLLFTLGLISSGIHRIAPPWLGLTILFILLSFDILDKKGFQQNIDWPSMIFLGGLIGVIGTVNHYGLQNIFLENLTWLGWYIENDFELFVLFLLGIVTVVRLIVPYGVVVVIGATILIPLAQNHGINPWIACFLLLVFGKSWIFPAQFPPFAQFMKLTGRGKEGEKYFLIFNMIMNFVKILAIYVSIPFWRSLGLL